MINLASITDTNYLKNLKLTLHGNIDQTLVHSLHGLLNFEIHVVGLDCRVMSSIYFMTILYTCNTYFVVHRFV